MSRKACAGELPFQEPSGAVPGRWCGTLSLGEMEQGFLYLVHHPLGSWFAFHARCCQGGAVWCLTPVGASQAAVAVWLLWESPGGDESGKCLWKNMEGVEQDFPLVHGGDSTIFLSWAGFPKPWTGMVEGL